MKKILTVLFCFFCAFQLNAKTLFFTKSQKSTITLYSPDKTCEFYHIVVTGKQSNFSKDIIHIYFSQMANSYDYVKSVLEKTPQNSTYLLFVSQSIKMDKTGILYWNDFNSTQKYMKSKCFYDERFYYSYDTPVFQSKMNLSAQ